LKNFKGAECPILSIDERILTSCEIVWLYCRRRRKFHFYNSMGCNPRSCLKGVHSGTAP